MEEITGYKFSGGQDDCDQKTNDYMHFNKDRKVIYIYIYIYKEREITFFFKNNALVTIW